MAENVSNQQNSSAAVNHGGAAVEGREIFAHEGDDFATIYKDYPVGFRFVPTDAELIEHYLIKKLNDMPLPPNKNIHEVDLYGSTPSQLTQQYKQSDGGEEWYFFTPRNRKYPNGKRPNRAAGNGDGYWKPTADEKPVVRLGQKDIIGYKRNLDYYEGLHSDGKKSIWKMHEYTVRNRCTKSGQVLDKWVLCKIYVTRNKVNSVHENGDSYACSTSQDVNGVPSMADSLSQHVNRPPLMAKNNYRVDATRMVQDPNVSSYQHDYNGTPLMATNGNKIGNIAPLSYPCLRPTYASRNPYLTASFSELPTNGASSMAGHGNTMAGMSASQILNAYCPQLVNGVSLMAGSYRQDINGAPSMAGNNNTMYAFEPAHSIPNASSQQAVNGVSPVAGYYRRDVNAAPSMEGNNNILYAFAHAHSILNASPMVGSYPMIDSSLQKPSASTQVVHNHIDTAYLNPMPAGNCNNVHVWPTEISTPQSYQNQNVNAWSFQQDFNAASSVGDSLQNPMNVVNGSTFLTRNNQFPDAHPTHPRGDIYGVSSSVAVGNGDNVHVPQSYQNQYVNSWSSQQDFNAGSSMGNSLQNPMKVVNGSPFVTGNNQFSNNRSTYPWCDINGVSSSMAVGNDNNVHVPQSYQNQHSNARGNYDNITHTSSADNIK